MKTTIQHIFLTLALLLSVAGTASSQTFIRGDVNGDGEIDITDVTVLVDYLNTGNFNLVARTLSFAENTTAVNKTYGDAAFTITATPSAGSGDGTLSYSSSTTSVATVDATTGEVTIVGIGETTITASITASANYAAAQKSYTLTVSQATISPTLTLAGWTYGSPNSPSVTGNTGNGVVTYYYKTGESEWTTTQPTAAGTHQVKACIAAASNYSAAETSAVSFTISQLEAVLGWSNTSLSYNGSEQQPTATVSNLISGDECTVTVTGAQTNVGNYTATASALSNSNYSLPSANTEAFSISAIDAVITSAPTFISDDLTYTGSAQELVTAGSGVTGGTLKYFVNTTGDTPTNETSGWSESLPQGTDATIYHVWYYVAADANHVSTAIAAISGTKSIGQKEVTVGSGITASNKTYDGTTAATLDYSGVVITGKVDGDNLSVTATGTFADATVGDGKTVSISGISLTGTSAGNYQLAATGNQASITANITKATLTATPANASRGYNTENPAFTVNVTGFVNGENTSTAAGYVAPTASSTATTSSNVGTYEITASGGSATNYDFSYTAGTLTITQVAGTLTCTNDALSFSASDGANSTKTKTSVSCSGGTISVQSSNTSNCTVTFSSGTITVTRVSEAAWSETITVSVTPDGNHTAPSNVTFSVSATACDPGVALSSSKVGDIVGSNGKAYDVSLKNSLPSGVTARGVVTYKNGTSGIVVALSNCADSYTWANRNNGLSSFNNSNAVSGKTWICGSKDQYTNALTSNWNIKNGYITAAGGNALGSSLYWSSTEYDSDYAWSFGNGSWYSYGGKGSNNYVRPLFAF